MEVVFTSSPNIAKGGTAVYNCSTNNSLVTVSNWILNKTISASTLASYGVTAHGTGSTVSSLIIPGLVNPFNNTEVLCYASGPGFGDVSPPSVMLWIQGRLESPTAVQSNDSCCYNFNWSPPFTLPGVPILGYNINVTNNNGAVLQISDIKTTQWKYCPKEFGDHIVSVAAVNGVGEGDAATFNLLMNQCKLCSSNISNDLCLHFLTVDSVKFIQQYRDAYQNWILIVRISVSYITNNYLKFIFLTGCGKRQATMQDH